MKRRRMREPVLTRVNTGMQVKIVPFAGAAPLVTLEDPRAGAEPARGAFARLRPPPDTPADETASWRESVEAVARVVRVLPTPRSADVPAEVFRPGDVDVGGIREEVLALARDAGDPLLVDFVEQVLAVVEKPR